MELATYMHDWGAFPKYIQKGVEHAVRSRQVVESDILPHRRLTADQKDILLETIELHDYRDPERVKWVDSIENKIRTLIQREKICVFGVDLRPIGLRSCSLSRINYRLGKMRAYIIK